MCEPALSFDYQQLKFVLVQALITAVFASESKQNYAGGRGGAAVAGCGCGAAGSRRQGCQGQGREAGGAAARRGGLGQACGGAAGTWSLFFSKKKTEMSFRRFGHPLLTTSLAEKSVGLVNDVVWCMSLQRSESQELRTEKHEGHAGRDWSPAASTDRPLHCLQQGHDEKLFTDHPAPDNLAQVIL